MTSQMPKPWTAEQKAQSEAITTAYEKVNSDPSKTSDQKREAFFVAQKALRELAVNITGLKAKP